MDLYSKYAWAGHLNGRAIVIDPGHGGDNPGGIDEINGSRHGGEIYYYIHSEQGRALALSFYKSLQQTVRDLQCQVLSKDFFILSKTSMPSVLIEMGYITNYREGPRLLTPTYQERLAEAFAAAINKYFRRIRKTSCKGR
ncbi:MAG: N-acetylmuramoyl-L-alanine amidase [Peptococcaceae bacterium]|nr:N-acetylmuramoyl-L-alanine amidase [Peptococcaceae bacterium]